MEIPLLSDVTNGLRYAARYLAIVAVVMLIADAVLSFAMTGTIENLAFSHSSYGVEQGLGWLLYFVQAILSPVSAGLLLALAVVCALTARRLAQLGEQSE